MDNKDLIQKAIDSSWGGQLNAEDAKEFFSTVRDQSGWLSMVNWIPMEAGSFELHNFQDAGDSFRAGTEGTTPSHIVSGSTEARTITLSEAVLPYDVTYKQMNHTILVNDSVDQFLETEFSKVFKNGISNNAITGSSANPTPQYAVFDGMLKLALADSNVTDTSTNYTASDYPYKNGFKTALKALPDKYRFQEEDLVILCSWDIADEYANEASDRATPEGDRFSFSGGTPDYRGIPVVPVAQMPSNTFILTMWSNLNVGYSIKNGVFKVGYFDNTRKRQHEFTITGELGFNYAAGDAVVYHTFSVV